MACNKNKRNFLEELGKIICEIDSRKPEPDCCNMTCPPFGCPLPPRICCFEGVKDPCCPPKCPPCPQICVVSCPPKCPPPPCPSPAPRLCVVSCPPKCPPSPCPPPCPKPKCCVPLSFLQAACAPKKYCMPPICFPPPARQDEGISMCQMAPLCSPPPCPPPCPKPCPSMIQICCPPVCPPPHQPACMISCPLPCPPPTCPMICPPPSCPMPCPPPCPMPCSTFIVSIPPR